MLDVIVVSVVKNGAGMSECVYYFLGIIKIRPADGRYSGKKYAIWRSGLCFESLNGEKQLMVLIVF